MAITGDVDGEPMKVGVAVVDVTTGLFTAVGICAALRERDIGTRPACRRQSLCVGNWLAGERCVNTLVSGNDAKRYGNAHANIVPYQAFRARDSYMSIAVGTDRQFAISARSSVTNRWPTTRAMRRIQPEWSIGKNWWSYFRKRSSRGMPGVAIGLP
ncbi:MAG: CoA transferase [Thermomicrobiales bacterium]